MTHDEFWDARPILQHIRDAARARMAGPWAVLGVTLTRAVSTVPPKVRLAPMIGGQGSLNVFLALVGPSGGGKGTAEAAAADAVRFLDNEANDAVPAGVPLGSGEGVARTFRPAGQEEPILSAIFTAPEVDTVTTLTGRQGATLGAELRKMFSGEALGFANSAVHTRCIVGAHDYRACLIAGVQPLRSRPLLDAADGGLPQRFLWMPVGDLDAPDEAPPRPAPQEFRTIDWGRSSAPIELELPDIAVRQIRQLRLRVLRGDPEVDPLDGHLLLVRAKVAVGLAVLDCRRNVTLEDWNLAGVVMSVSAVQREVCRRALLEQSRKRNVARAIEDDERDEVWTARKVQRARAAITRHLERHGEQTRAELRRRLKLDIREHFDAAISDLLDEGSVIESEAEKGGTKYTGTPVHPPLETVVPAHIPEERGDTGEGHTYTSNTDEYTGVPIGVPETTPLPAQTPGCTGVSGVPVSSDKVRHHPSASTASTRGSGDHGAAKDSA